jgi:CNT family concentrative nucleoside transporter
MLFAAWALSEHRRVIPWRVIIWGLGLQLGLGVLVLLTPFGTPFFGVVRGGFDAITAASMEGARFVFGNLSQFFIIERALTPGPEGMQPVEGFPIAALIAFQVLPTIIFVAGLAAVLQHLGITQRVIAAIAWLMRRTLRTSGAETFAAALEVFMGIEAVSALGPYIERMTRST